MIDRVDRAARAILEARRTGVPLETLAPSDQPQSLEEAYAIQQAVTARWPDKIAGWKVGATSKEVQTLLGTTEPIYAPVFKSGVFRSPATIPARDFQHRFLESEFIFEFGKGLPTRQTPYSRDDIIDAVDALFPGFEIISPRFRSLTGHHVFTVVADSVANGGAVLGRICTDWRHVDLASQSVVLSIGGAERQRGTGALALGHPLNVLDWFVSVLSRNGGSIEAGQFVMTGTVTGVHAPDLGQTAKTDFGPLGMIEAVFA
jgi:2-keto-4-pentenoate hydratase